MLIQSAEQGAEPGLRAATDLDLQSGLYVGPSGFMEALGSPGLVKAGKQAYDKKIAKELWEISKSLTNI